MRLFTSPNSPYGRTVRVLVEETGLVNRVRVEFVPLRDSASPLLDFNPAGKVPSLHLESGETLSETRMVLEHLDALHGGERMLAGIEEFEERAREGCLFGCLEGIANLNREYRRPEPMQYGWLLELEHARAARCFDHFDKDHGLLGGRLRLSHLALGCVIGYADTFLDAFDWRGGRPRLSAWFDEFARRPSMWSTAPSRTP